MDREKSKKEKKRGNIFISLYGAFKNFVTAFPIIFGIVLLLGLLRTYVSPQLISSVFRGKRFAFFRNLLSFILSIVVAIATVLMLEMIQ